jgi:hypothetical protein
MGKTWDVIVHLTALDSLHDEGKKSPFAMKTIVLGQRLSL